MCSGLDLVQWCLTRQIIHSGQSAKALQYGLPSLCDSSWFYGHWGRPHWLENINRIVVCLLFIRKVKASWQRSMNKRKSLFKGRIKIDLGKKILLSPHWTIHNYSSQSKNCYNFYMTRQAEGNKHIESAYYILSTLQKSLQ